MFGKILIANRGEIACRIAATARRLGIRCVAVYSDADRNSRHVALADDAVHIGPSPPADSYLRGAAIIDAALSTGAEAVHPGYGFLAENAEFAEQCAAAGVVFIGPPAAAIRAMGSKIEAKRIMDQAGVPTVPGYHGDQQDPELLRREAQSIGWPVLLKASAGGGGKGMRIVHAAPHFDDALASARREAMGAFGDDRMLIEKYLQPSRHIEVQVFADRHGEAVHLFERDCSVQRRHQKVLEEAPAPNLTLERRAQMGATAVTAASSIGYVGAGTVEFIVADDAFYFMEMNTRLQVEHPVTEVVTGEDLVEWQLRIAAGEPLARRQDELAVNGHALEARLYAEDPDRDFLPVTGTLAHLRFPQSSTRVRIDTGVREADTISMHYDPMIAKLITWGEDRNAAVAAMRRALEQTEVVGLATNTELLKRIVAHPEFAAGRFDTGFIDQHAPSLTPAPATAGDTVIALACLHTYVNESEQAAEAARLSADPHSPWNSAGGWRLNEDNFHTLHFRDTEHSFEIVTHYRGSEFVIELPSGATRATGSRAADGRLVAEIDGRVVHARVVEIDDHLTVFCNGERFELQRYDPMGDSGEVEGVDGSLRAPMPGKVIDVLIAPGASVARGEVLMVLEAMKMEHSIRAPMNGTVETIHCAVGDAVEEGVELLVVGGTDRE